MIDRNNTGKANNFFNVPQNQNEPDIKFDPMEKRELHFTMKVNQFELDLMDRCSQIGRISKAALVRHLIDEYAKEKGIF